MLDSRNTTSNEYYKGLVYEIAYLFLTNNDSSDNILDVAKKIIDKNKAILNTNTYERFLGTDYPKIMLDEWIEVVSNSKYNYLGSDFKIEGFFVFYHYFIDNNSLNQ